MKLKHLKHMLNKLSLDELEQDVIYNSDTLMMSGKVVSAKKARVNLYYDGRDSPSPLKTMAQLKEEYDADEIKAIDVYIKKGDIVFEL